MKLVISLSLEFPVLKKILKNSEEVSIIYQNGNLIFLVNHGEAYFLRTHEAFINEETSNMVAHTLPSNILSKLPHNKKGLDTLSIMITDTGLELVLNDMPIQVATKIFNVTFFNNLKTQLAGGKVVSSKWLLWAQQVLRITGDTTITLHKGYISLRGKQGLFIYKDESLDPSLSISFSSWILKRVELKEVKLLQLMSGSMRLTLEDGVEAFTATMNPQTSFIEDFLFIKERFNPQIQLTVSLSDFKEFIQSCRTEGLVLDFGMKALVASSDYGEKVRMPLNNQIKQEFRFKSKDQGEKYKEMIALNDKVKALRITDSGVLRLLSGLDNFLFYPTLGTHIIHYSARCFYLAVDSEVG